MSNKFENTMKLMKVKLERAIEVIGRFVGEVSKQIKNLKLFGNKKTDNVKVYVRKKEWKFNNEEPDELPSFEEILEEALNF